METINKLEALGEEAYDLAEAKLHLLKLKTVNKTAAIASAGVWSISLFVLALLFVLMVNIGLALWLGEKMGKAYYGFFVVSLVYILGALILGIFKKQLIKTPMVNFVIKSFLHA
jgi:hypothetical protein